MPVVFAIFLAAAALWWWVYARHGSLLLGCAFFLAVGYALGHSFWHVSLGPVTLTFERLWLVSLIAVFVWKWRYGQLQARTLTGSDLLLLLFVGYITIRAILTPDAAEGTGSEVSASWRLIASFWMPAVIYWIARGAACNERIWKVLLASLTLLGCYLAATAFAEITHQWWAVFPRYIADPTLGTHFGRARGPALMSASLGVFLTACFWAAWFLWERVGKVWKMTLIAAMGAMTLAVYFTYTRSTWLGLVGGLACIPLLHLRREWRTVFLGAGLVVGVLGAIALGDKVLNLGRKDTDGRADHSVYQRASFVYVSMRMFSDQPLFGCGFGRFYDRKIPYLANRSQQLELESLRNLEHHNSFLSLLIETGLIGLSLLLAMLVAWGRAAWELVRDADDGSWTRTQGLFSLAVMIAYLTNAMFHDLTLSPTEQWLLYLVAGVTVGLQSAGRCLDGELNCGNLSWWTALTTMKLHSLKNLQTP